MLDEERTISVQEYASIVGISRTAVYKRLQSTNTSTMQTLSTYVIKELDETGKQVTRLKIDVLTPEQQEQLKLTRSRKKLRKLTNVDKVNSKVSQLSQQGDMSICQPDTERIIRATVIHDAPQAPEPAEQKAQEEKPDNTELVEVLQKQLERQAQEIAWLHGQIEELQADNKAKTQLLLKASTQLSLLGNSITRDNAAAAAGVDQSEEQQTEPEKEPEKQTGPVWWEKLKRWFSE